MPEAECRLDHECLDIYGSVHYLPNLLGNYLFLGIFGAVLVSQIGLGIRFKTWGYMGAMLGGTVLEAVGYFGRIQMNKKPFDGNNFSESRIDPGYTQAIANQYSRSHLSGRTDHWTRLLLGRHLSLN